MCRGFVWRHPECQHEKKFEVLPQGHCEAYRLQDDKDHHIDGHCNGILTVVHVNMVTAPLLCVACFRNMERSISAAYDGHIRVYRRDHADITAELPETTNPRHRQFYELELRNLQEEIEDAKISRKLKIAEFRSKQGVWADG